MEPHHRSFGLFPYPSDQVGISHPSPEMIFGSLASSPLQDGLGVTTLSDEPSACHCKGYTFPRWTKSVEIYVRCSLTSFDFMCLYFEEWLLLLY